MLMSRGLMMSGPPPTVDKPRGEMTFIIGEMSRLLKLFNSERAVFGLTSLSLLSCFVIKINWVSLLIGIMRMHACGPQKLRS